MIERQCFLADENATLELGAALAACLVPGDVLHLHGELGAGKTTLVRGFLRACGYQGAVKSPTYTLVESYPLADRLVHHFDLYRIADPEELEFLGLDEYLRGDATALIEWPERGAGVLPASVAEVELVREGSGRRVSIKAHEKCTAKLDFLLKSTQY